VRIKRLVAMTPHESHVETIREDDSCVDGNA